MLIRLLRWCRETGLLCAYIGVAVALVTELTERWLPAKDLYLIPISDLDRFVVVCAIGFGVLYLPAEITLIFRDMWKEHHLRT